MALVVGGAMLYGYSFLRLRQISHIDTAPQRAAMVDSGQAALTVADYYWRYSRAGIAVFVAGVALSVWAYWRHRSDAMSGRVT
jgi:hypothetical protein